MERNHPNWSVFFSKSLPGSIPGVPGDSLEGTVRRAAPMPVFVIEDLKAKSAAWDSPVTNARGPEVQDWVADIWLVVRQSSTAASTCVR